MMLKNNLLSFACYFVIGWIVYFLVGLSSAVFQFQASKWELLFSIPILIITPILFVLAGRYFLRNQRPGVRDLLSVLLVCLLGLACTPSMAFYKQQPVGNLSVASLYFIYVSPLADTMLSLKNNWDPWGIGKGNLCFGIVYSVIPSVLMWVGLRWRARS